MKAVDGIGYIEKRKDDLINLAQKIYDYAEIGLEEYKSADAVCSFLASSGFSIQRPVSHMPTAFVATWGEGKPVIGFLGEYDALLGISQAPVPYKKEVAGKNAAHACGHNLLGVGALGGALGLKKEMEKRGIEGTVKFFGCPAEENYSGKAFMARDGLFQACDACLTWHPSSLNRVQTGSSLANNSFNVHFRGRTAHAAADPYNGRSALDAVQLMNMGAEFLREHVITERVRFHYVIKDGGSQPNVVPDKATVWYLVRAATRPECDGLYERILNCAEGAAKMTDTAYEIEMIKAIWNLLPNTVLEDLLEDCLKKVGPPNFKEEDFLFAEEISKTMDRDLSSFMNRHGLLEEVKGEILNTTIIPKQDPPPVGFGSTDVADCSWSSPTAQFYISCQAIGTPGHSWQYAAQAGMGIGHAGMIAAAKVLTEAGINLMTDGKLLSRAKEEFLLATGGKPFKSALLKDQKPFGLH